MAVCQYHRDRPGIGVCMRCRAVICSACCTRVDGVNHCHACLKALGKKVPTRTWSGAAATLSAVVGLVLSWLFFVGVFFLLQGRLSP